MDKTIVIALIAAAGPLIAASFGLLYYRQTKGKKISEIGIDEATRNKIVNDAAMINQQREQLREEWWITQVKKLRDEIGDERDLSNRRFKRLNQIEDWAMLHMAWDRKAWAKLLEDDPDFPPPPPIPEDTAHERTAGNGAS
jgi:hypothetical protein